MIYLVSLIEQSYANREMDNAEYFLNTLCKKIVAKHITNIYDLKNIHADDYVVVADYKCHPLYDSLEESIKLVYDDVFNNINANQLIIWTGDIRFKYTWRRPNKAIGSYMSIWENINSKQYSHFKKLFSQDIQIVTWKTLLPELLYDYSLSESQCYWGNFILSDKSVDLTYIMHGAIKYRLSQLKWLDKLHCSVMLGNWLNRTEPEVVDFVCNNTDYSYVNYKMFNESWLNLISKAKYTIIADDDTEQFTSTLSARFWEAVRADCIPLIHIKKDPERKIFAGFDALQTCSYFKNEDDIRRILALKPMYYQCMYELKSFVRKYFGGILQ